MTTLTRPYAVAQLVRDRAKELSNNPVFSYQDEHLSYANLHVNSDITAKALLVKGFKKGDRIAFLGKNSPVYFELIAAVAKIGAVVVPINWRLASAELSYILNDSQASLLFVEPLFFDTVASIQSSLDYELSVCVINGDHTDAISYLELQSQGDLADISLDSSSYDDADVGIVQLYTSGTTGKPKGAVLTSRMLTALRGQEEAFQVPDWQGYEIGETGLLVMPCFHVGGTSFGLGIIYNGAHSVVLPEYDQNEVIDLIEKFKVSKAFMVPAALQSLLNNPRIDTADLSSLNHIYYGASPIPLELMRAAIERFDCGFVQMYGMTESGGTIVALPPEDHDPDSNDAAVINRMNSVGKPLQGVEIKVIDEQGNTLKNGQTGEIATRSVKNIIAYWNRPEATQSTIDKNGWLRTGDAGYIDDDGYLYIQDRVKDMIISGGENIYPAEVENALYAHQAIQEVAVIGVPDDKWGETVKAVVVLREGQSADPESIIKFSRERIAAYKCPKSIAFIDALPRNATGKVLRKDLRAPYWKGRSRSVN